MRIEVDRDRCIGAGMCALTAPSVFEQDDDGLSQVLPGPVHGAVESRVRDAARSCPAQAITIAVAIPER